MKKVLGLIIFIFLIICTNCHAAQFNVLVLPADMYNDATYYMVYPKSAEIVSGEIVNYYAKNAKMSSVPINKVRAYLDRPENSRLKKEVQQLLTEYQNNYTINFNTVQKVSSRFKTKHVLLVGCNLDTQNYITRRVIWDFLEIPNTSVIDTAYRISTNVNLIDANNQIILWNKTYQKLISSRENRIIPQQMSQGTEQLEKIKKYTINFLAPQIVQETQLALINISPYQNLNAKPDIVKPTAISIDKLKIDSKRATVRGAIFTKKQTIKAGKAIKRNTKNFIATKKQNRLERKIAKEQRKLVESRLTTEEKIQIAQQKEQARFNKLQEQQSIKYAKAKQKMEVDDARIKAQQQSNNELDKQKIELSTDNRKLLLQQKFEQGQQRSELNMTKQQLQQEKRKEIEQKRAELRKQRSAFNSKQQKEKAEWQKEFQEKQSLQRQEMARQEAEKQQLEENNTQNDENIQEISQVERKKESFLKKIKRKNKKKKEQQAEKQTEREIQVQTQIVPSSTIMQQDLKPAPFIRTRPMPKEKDFTINDI